MVKFTATKREIEVIMAIATRACAMAAECHVQYPYQDAMMDIEACHCNGQPLKLFDLAAADAANFSHDVFGIRRHINRETGQLEDCFRPRYAQAEGVTEVFIPNAA